MTSIKCFKCGFIRIYKLDQVAEKYRNKLCLSCAANPNKHVQYDWLLKKFFVPCRKCGAKKIYQKRGNALQHYDTLCYSCSNRIYPVIKVLLTEDKRYAYICKKCNKQSQTYEKRTPCDYGYRLYKGKCKYCVFAERTKTAAKCFQNLKGEEWKKIAGCNYSISNKQRVRNDKTYKIMKPLKMGQSNCIGYILHTPNGEAYTIYLKNLMKTYFYRLFL